MTESTPRAATRLQRPSWRDTRLLVGLLLVLGSAVAGSAVVAAADDRDPVWAASRELLPGETVEERDLTRVDVRVDDVGTRYLSAGEALPVGSVVRRQVGVGELVPREAVVPADEARLRVVSVPMDPAAVHMLSRGSVVSVWASSRQGGASSAVGRPKLVLEDVTVHAVPEVKGMLTASGASSVRLLVRRQDVRDIADLVAREAVFFVAADERSLPEARS